MGFSSSVGRIDTSHDVPPRQQQFSIPDRVDPFGQPRPSHNSSSITVTTRANSGGWVIRAISATWARTIPIAQASLTPLLRLSRSCANSCRRFSISLAPGASTSSPQASPWRGNGCCRTMPIARCGGLRSPSMDPITASLTARPPGQLLPVAERWRLHAKQRGVRRVRFRPHAVADGTERCGRAPGPTRYLVIRNKPGTPDFVYNSLAVVSCGITREDRNGNRHDFTASAGLDGAEPSSQGHSTRSSPPPSRDPELSRHTQRGTAVLTSLRRDLEQDERRRMDRFMNARPSWQPEHR